MLFPSWMLGRGPWATTRNLRQQRLKLVLWLLGYNFSIWALVCSRSCLPPQLSRAPALDCVPVQRFEAGQFPNELGPSVSLSCLIGQLTRLHRRVPARLCCVRPLRAPFPLPYCSSVHSGVRPVAFGPTPRRRQCHCARELCRVHLRPAAACAVRSTGTLPGPLWAAAGLC